MGRSSGGGWQWRLRIATALIVALTTLVGVASAGAAGSGDWTTYLHDNARSGFNPSETAINAASAPSLAPRWIGRAGETISTQATVASGLIYWGSWDGLEHATDPGTGGDKWTAYLGQETKADCSPPHLGVASTATVTSIKINGRQRSVLFTGGGDGKYYALDATNGSVLWSRSFGSPQDGYFMWSSPAVYNGSVFVGVASIGDCPLVPGQLVKLNAANGTIQQVFNTVPAGCVGGGIWTSPTIDEATDTLYVSTGTIGGCNAPEPYAQAVLQLSTKTLALVASWKAPDAEQVPDGDFGATPTLFTATIGGTARQLVGMANKNGIYYAFDRRNIGTGPIWKSGLISTDPDTIASSAWDGKRLYVAGHHTTINGALCEGSMRAIDPATGAFHWERCLSGGGANGALTAVPGMVFMGIGSILYGLDAASGAVLFSYQDTSFHWFYAPASVANGVLYIGNSDGNFYAFTPGGK